MDFKEFLNEVVERLPDYMLTYDIDKICIEKIEKNNGVICSGLIICIKGENISPNIYMEFFYTLYEQGRPMEEILKLIVQEYAAARERLAKENFIDDKEDVRDRIFMRLINYERNKNMLENCPHTRFHDLAITFRYLVKKSDEGIASTIINYRELERLEISEDELMQLSENNTFRLFPPRLERMDDLLYELTGNRMSDELPMYVLSNESCINGATSILSESVLEEAEALLGESFYILPSSVHEVLLLPVSSGGSAEYLKSLVEEVNSNVLNDMEYLSDNVYFYDYEEGRISVANRLQFTA